MRKAVQFGAGNIGRGFLGQILNESGFEIVYVDVDVALIDLLNRRRSYPLRLVDSAGNQQDMTIGPVRAVAGTDTNAVADELATADIAGTSVGPRGLDALIGHIVSATKRRFAAAAPPLNILLCENQWRLASTIWDAITPRLNDRELAYARGHIGLVETSIGRMVPAPTAQTRAIDPLLVLAEPFLHLPVARAHVVGDLPVLVGTEAHDDFDAYVARKLFIHNAAHASVAYLAYPAYEFIWQAVADRGIRANCEAALGEARQALVAAYGFDAGDLKAFADDLLVRFENKTLGDPVARVAADPLRKLRPDDRLVGAANLCVEHGIEPRALARVIAAALRYDNPADPSAVRMQELIRSQGRDYFLQSHCGLDRDSVVAILVAEA